MQFVQRLAPITGNVTMRAYRLEATVPPNGQLQLNSIPFQPGEAVEIIILALEEELSESSQLAQGPIPTGLPADKLQQLDTRTSTAELAQRQASLAVIQSGKYRQAQQPGELLPSEAFASSVSCGSGISISIPASCKVDSSNLFPITTRASSILCWLLVAKINFMETR